jgi:hypothetical protein
MISVIRGALIIGINLTSVVEMSITLGSKNATVATTQGHYIDNPIILVLCRTARSYHCRSHDQKNSRNLPVSASCVAAVKLSFTMVGHF